jgi:hypothetical protein
MQLQATATPGASPGVTFREHAPAGRQAVQAVPG